jgi:hypothetical protein
MMPKLTSLYKCGSSSDDEVIDELYISEMPDEEWKEQLQKHTRDFQCNFIYHTLLKCLKKVLMV